MFKRILYEEWTLIVPIIAFAVTFSIFAYAFVRSLLMKKEKIEHLATLALQDDHSRHP